MYTVCLQILQYLTRVKFGKCIMHYTENLIDDRTTFFIIVINKVPSVFKHMHDILIKFPV